MAQTSKAIVVVGDVEAEKVCGHHRSLQISRRGGKDLRCTGIVFRQLTRVRSKEGRGYVERGQSIALEDLMGNHLSVEVEVLEPLRAIKADYGAYDHVAHFDVPADAAGRAGGNY